MKKLQPLRQIRRVPSPGKCGSRVDVCVSNDIEQIDVAVNAPEAGTIMELLAKEEDTVKVGQDIVKMELGGEPKSGQKEEAKQDPKGAASDQQATSSDPKPQEEEMKPAKSEKPSPTESKKEPEPRKEAETKKQEPSKPPPQKEPPPQQNPSKPQSSRPAEAEGLSTPSPDGSREERRVIVA